MDNTEIVFVSDAKECSRILADPRIIKLHYQNGHCYGSSHKNWGETKGEDCYNDVCVLLNKSTAKKFAEGKLKELAPSTRNKLYVAITRAHGNVYFINE
jgi:ATP-dependent exoDNAse (exonuclease V) beta subunit